MAKKIRSIKGVLVDFDLLRIKQQIAQNPAPVNVQEREAFIDKKVRRRARKKTRNVNLDIDAEIKQELEVEEDDISEVDMQSAEPQDASQPTPRPVKKQRKPEAGQ